MKTQHIFKKVGSILAEINEQYQYLAEAPENLNDLELELLSANADFLAEHIKVLKKLNLSDVKLLQEASRSDISQSEEYKESVNVTEIENADHLIKQEFPENYSSFHKEIEPKATEKEETPVAEDLPEPIDTDLLIKQELPESYSSFHKPAENEIPAALAATEDLRQEAYQDPAEVREQNFLPVQEQVAEPAGESSFNAFFTPEANPIANNEPVEGTQVIEEVVPEAEPLVEPSKPVEEPLKVPTINDMMSAQRSQDPLSRFNKPQTVSDLKSIISLNDKLLFIKDLFNGYSLAYSEAIEIISRFDSFTAADNFLKTNYSVKNNWAVKQATADKFYELLNRRFSK
jgi:hypothetical protein